MQITLGGRSLAAAVAVCALVVGAGVAYATIPSSSGTYNACLAPAGTIRLIDSDAGQKCRSSEKAISWSQAAPQPVLTCPSGTIMSTGVCYETTSRAAAAVFDARDDCADEGRRLPSPGEASTARLLAEVDLGNGEWTDDVADINRVNSTTGVPYGDFSYLAVAEHGNGVVQATSSLPYRCVAAAEIG